MRSFFTASLALIGAAGLAAAAPAPAQEQKLAARSNSGKATFFEPGLGACGWQSSSGDAIVALTSKMWDGGSHCGKWVTMEHNGAKTSAKIVDECPTCEGNAGLDLSPSQFSHLASQDQGEIDIQWWFQ